MAAHEGSYGVVVGDIHYWLIQYSATRVFIWSYDNSITTVISKAYFTEGHILPDNESQRGIAYDGNNLLYFIIKKTSDSKNYLVTYSISGNSYTIYDEFNIALMLDRNVSSGNREKAFHITDYEIYELTNNKSNLLMIDTPALDSATSGITDNFLITGDATPVVWEYVDQEKELIDSCNIDYKRGNPTNSTFIAYEELLDNEGVLFYDDNDEIIFEGSIIEKEYDEVDKWTYKCMGFDVELINNKLTISASNENAKTLVQRVLDKCNYLTYTSTSITDPSINITLEPKNLNVRTILKTIADLCEYVFYVSPTGIVYFNDGTTSSGKTVTYTSGITGKPKVKDIPVQINYVKVSGGIYIAGVKVWKIAENVKSQLKYGKNRYIDHFPLIEDATELQNIADKILARKGMADNPKYIYTMLYNLNFVQCGEQLNLAFSPLNLAATDYYILNQKYNAKKNEGKFVISSGIVLNWRGYGYSYGKTTEADEAQIDALAALISGVGEANTASSQGTGVSLYYTKVSLDLQFNAIKSENDRITISLDGGTHDIEVTLNEGNILHNSLGGLNAGDVYEHISQDQKNALHTIYSLEVHNNTYHDPNYAAEAITITAGTGLSGGGNLTQNRTINCDITQYTDALAVTALATEDVYVKIVGDVMSGDLTVNNLITTGNVDGVDISVFNAAMREQSSTFPVSPSEGDFHYDEFYDSFFRYNGEALAWVEIGVGGGRGSLNLIDEIVDVIISGTPANNELLAYDTGTSKWINQTAAEANLATPAQVPDYIWIQAKIWCSVSGQDYGEAVVLNAVGETVNWSVKIPPDANTGADVVVYITSKETSTDTLISGTKHLGACKDDGSELQSWINIYDDIAAGLQQSSTPNILRTDSNITYPNASIEDGDVLFGKWELGEASRTVYIYTITLRFTV